MCYFSFMEYDVVYRIKSKLYKIQKVKAGK